MPFDDLGHKSDYLVQEIPSYKEQLREEPEFSKLTTKTDINSEHHNHYEEIGLAEEEDHCENGYLLKGSQKAQVTPRTSQLPMPSIRPLHHHRYLWTASH